MLLAVVLTLFTELTGLEMAAPGCALLGLTSSGLIRPWPGLAEMNLAGVGEAEGGDRGAGAGPDPGEEGEVGDQEEGWQANPGAEGELLDSGHQTAALLHSDTLSLFLSLYSNFYSDHGFDCDHFCPCF